MTTRAYNISELGLMRLEDVLKSIYNDEGNDLEIAIHDLAFGEREHKVEIPIKSYAASVVDRFAECIICEHKRHINWDIAIYVKEEKVICFSNREKAYYYVSFLCPFNPFTGLLNPDRTPRTSATREEIEQWKKEG